MPGLRHRATLLLALATTAGAALLALGLLLHGGGRDAALAGGVLLLGATLAAWCWRLARSLRALTARLRRLEDGLGKVSWQTATARDVQGSVVRLRGNADDILARMDTLEGAQRDLALAVETRGTPPGAFDPGLVPASAVQARKHAHTAGRLAADLTVRSDERRNLRRLLLPERDAWTREVACIGSPGLRESLRAHGPVLPLYPRLGAAQLPPTVSYLVVEEAGLEGTGWAGALDAQATALGLDLLDLVRTAHRQGVVVVVVANAPATHFSGSLEALADVVLPAGGAALPWGEDVDLPVLHTVVTWWEESA